MKHRRPRISESQACQDCAHHLHLKCLGILTIQILSELCHSKGYRKCTTSYKCTMGPQACHGLPFLAKWLVTRTPGASWWPGPAGSCVPGARPEDGSLDCSIPRSSHSASSTRLPGGAVGLVGGREVLEGHVLAACLRAGTDLGAPSSIPKNDSTSTALETMT